MALQLPPSIGRFNLSVRSRPVVVSRRINTFATLPQPRTDPINGLKLLPVSLIKTKDQSCSSMSLKSYSSLQVCQGIQLLWWGLVGKLGIQFPGEMSCVCNLCNGGVKFIRDHDRNKRIRFEPLQSEAGKMLLQRAGRAPDDISSVVLVEKDRAYIKSEAVLKIMEYIDLPFPQLAFFLPFVPLFLRDFAYDNVANNRYTIFGCSESCEI